MEATHVLDAIRAAPAANQSFPMLLLRLREAMLLPLRPVIRQFDLSEQQARVLLVLNEATVLEMVALAEVCCLHPPSLSRIIPKLVARGLVERHKPDGDQRRVLVRLSPVGGRLAAELGTLLRRAHGETRRQLGEHRFRSLASDLEAAITTLDVALPEGLDVALPAGVSADDDEVS